MDRINNIKQLYKKYISSIYNEDEYDILYYRQKLLIYSKYYRYDTKLAFKEILEDPYNVNIYLPKTLMNLFPDEFKIIQKNKSLIDIPNVPTDKGFIYLNEEYINNLNNYYIDECNKWLNYFNNTNDIDYYEKYKCYCYYKQYHPFTITKPSLSYEEFCKKYDDITEVNNFVTNLRKENNIKII